MALALLPPASPAGGKYVDPGRAAMYSGKSLSESLAADGNIHGVDFTGFFPTCFAHLLRTSVGTGVRVAK